VRFSSSSLLGRTVLFLLMKVFAMTEAEQDKIVETLFGVVNGQPLRIPMIGLVGGKGSGKTFAGSSLCPEETTEIAVEDSGETYNFPFAKSYSMFKEVQTSNANGIPSQLDCYMWFMDLLPKIDTRILFIDPITDLQAGGYQYIVRNCTQFGLTAEQCKSSSGLVWGALKAHLKLLLGRVSRNLETIIYTSHTGLVWKNGKPAPGKVKAKGVDTFYELASLVVFLKRDVDPATGKQPDAPVGHITPPMGKARLSRITKLPDGSYGGQPLLPPRIDRFTWEEFRKSVNSPPNYAKLTAKQKAEVEVLTDDEKLELQAEIAENNAEAERLKMQRIEATKEAKERNRQALQKQAEERTVTEATTEQAPFDTEPTPTAELPTQKGQGEPDPANTILAVADRIEIIKKQATELWGKAAVAQLKASIEKRAGKDKKFADMTEEQVIDLQRTLWNALTKKEIGSEKK